MHAALSAIRSGPDVWNRFRLGAPGRIDLTAADLAGLDLRAFDLRDVTLARADLRDANLAACDLTGAILDGVKAHGAYMRSIRMLGGSAIDAEFLDANVAGAVFRDSDLRRADFLAADLGGAVLSGVALAGAKFRNARLHNAAFARCRAERAIFEGAEFRDCMVRDCQLDRAQLDGAHIAGGRFEDVSLAGASLLNAVIAGPTLLDVRLGGAVMGRTTIAGVSLSATTGLRDVLHRAPSSIAVDTLVASGALPESFLRDVGMPDSLVARFAIERLPERFYSCFLSYSSADEAFAKKLHADLREAKVRLWFAPEDLKAGDRLVSVIDDSIVTHERLLIVLSKNSLQSGWVAAEVERAIAQERAENCTVLAPITIDDAVMKAPDGWAKHLRTTRQISDFIHWQDPSRYARSLDRLLRDISREQHTSQ